MIGVETCFIDNFGACLQAYALQQTLIELGYSCEILNYQHQDVRNIQMYNKKTYTIKSKIIYVIKAIIKNPYFFRNRKNTHLRTAAFETFRNRYLTFSKESFSSFEDLEKNAANYDMYVCGSDQIWNPTLGYARNLKVEFLDFVPEDKKRIAYAPSIGVSAIPDKYKDDMITYLNKMSHLSVRENRGTQIIQELTGLYAPTVLDPTLLFTRERWCKETESIVAKKWGMHKKYILCYLFGDLEYIEKLISHVKTITNMQIVVLPYNKREYECKYKKVFDCGPLDFVALIRDAALVCTDSFHATAFSINLQVPFYSLLRNEINSFEDMSSRLISILHIMDLSERLITPEMKFPTERIFDLNFKKSEEVLTKMRIESMKYLLNALEC